jgi:hypothetical protein
MKTRVNSITAALCALLCVSSLPGCKNHPPLVTITVKQLGACNSWKDTESGPVHSAGPNAAFVVFNVSMVDNQANGLFAFDPSRLYVDVSGQPHMNLNYRMAKIIGTIDATPRMVPLGGIGFGDAATVAVVHTTATNGAAEANNTSYKLGYTTIPGDPPVTVKKSNEGQTAWPYVEDCRGVRR